MRKLEKCSFASNERKIMPQNSSHEQNKRIKEKLYFRQFNSHWFIIWIPTPTCIRHIHINIWSDFIWFHKKYLKLLVFIACQIDLNVFPQQMCETFLRQQQQNKFEKFHLFVTIPLTHFIYIICSNWITL